MKEKIKNFFDLKPYDELHLLRLFAIIGVLGILVLPICVVVIRAFGGSPSIYPFTFSDFGEVSAYFFAKNAYTGESHVVTSYAPIAYLLVFPFCFIERDQVMLYLKGNIFLSGLSQTWQNILATTLFFLFYVTLICIVVAKITKYKGEKLVYSMIITATFSCIIHAYLRGNTIIVSTLFVLLFLYLNNCEQRWKRELSYLCLGVSVAIKIFPALLALMLFRKRDYWGIVKAAIYSLLLYFIPFFFIDGGFSNLPYLIGNMFSFSERSDYFYMDNLSFSSYVALLHYALDWTGYSQVVTYVVQGITYTLDAIYLGIAIYACFAFKDGKRKTPFILMIMGAYFFLPGVNFSYSAAILLYPLFTFVKELDAYSKKEKIYYSIFFGALCFYSLNSCLWMSVTGIITLFLCFGSIYLVYKDGKEDKKKEREASSLANE